MLKTELQSYLDVVGLISKAFTQYVEAKQLGYEVTVKPPALLKAANPQANNVLLIYKLQRRQQGSQKMPFQERTFMRPIPVNLSIGAGGIAQEQQFKYFLDNMIEFDLYSTDYSLVSRATEDFISYMSMLNITSNVFTKNGYQIPVFWEQKEDEIEDIGGTKLYKTTLLYQVQTEQTITKSIDVIRKIDTYVEMIS